MLKRDFYNVGLIYYELVVEWIIFSGLGRDFKVVNSSVYYFKFPIVSKVTGVFEIFLS